MKKLIITDVINFTDDVNNIHDINLWKEMKHGIYEVSFMANNQRFRTLLMWGIDSNFPHQAPVIMTLPIPTVEVFYESKEPRIPEIDPLQLVQFDGTAITGDVLLKAIAISQDPNLAKDLLK